MSTNSTSGVASSSAVVSGSGLMADVAWLRASVSNTQPSISYSISSNGAIHFSHAGSSSLTSAELPASRTQSQSVSKRARRRARLTSQNTVATASTTTGGSPSELPSPATPSSIRRNGGNRSSVAAGSTIRSSFIPYSSLMPTEQLARVKKLFPTYEYKMVDTINTHALSNVRRAIEHRQLLKQIGATNGRSFIDVGGKLSQYSSGEYQGVHVCKPVLDGRDAARWENDLHFLRSLPPVTTSGADSNSRSAANILPLLDHTCQKPAQDCSYPADSAIFLHSLYDIDVSTLGKILDSHDIRYASATIIFDLAILDCKTGYIPGHDCDFSISTIFGPRRVEFFFRGDSANAYSHDLASYIRLVTATHIVGPNNVYIVERNVVDGTMYMNFTRSFLPIGTKSRLSFQLWQNYRSTDVFVDGIKFNSASGRTGVSAIERRTLCVPSLFVDRVLAQAVGVPASKFNLSEMWNYSRGINTVFTLNGVEVTVEKGLGHEDFSDLIVSLYVIALKQRFERELLVSYFADKHDCSAVITTMGVFDLARFFVQHSVSWLYETEHFAGASFYSQLLNYARARAASQLNAHNKVDVGVRPVTNSRRFCDIIVGYETMVCDYAGQARGYAHLIDDAILSNKVEVTVKQLDEFAAQYRVAKSAEDKQALREAIDLLRRQLVVLDPLYMGGSWSELEDLSRELDECIPLAEKVTTIVPSVLDDADDDEFVDAPEYPRDNDCLFTAVAKATGEAPQQVWNQFATLTGTDRSQIENEQATPEVVTQLAIALDATISVATERGTIKFGEGEREINITHADDHYDVESAISEDDLVGFYDDFEPLPRRSRMRSIVAWLSLLFLIITICFVFINSFSVSWTGGSPSQSLTSLVTTPTSTIIVQSVTPTTNTRPLYTSMFEKPLTKRSFELPTFAPIPVPEPVESIVTLTQIATHPVTIWLLSHPVIGVILIDIICGLLYAVSPLFVFLAGTVTVGYAAYALQSVPRELITAIAGAMFEWMVANPISAFIVVDALAFVLTAYFPTALTLIVVNVAMGLFVTRNSPTLSKRAYETYYDVFGALVPPAFKPGFYVICPKCFDTPPSLEQCFDFVVRIIALPFGLLWELIGVTLVHILVTTATTIMTVVFKSVLVFGACYLLSFVFYTPGHKPIHRPKTVPVFTPPPSLDNRLKLILKRFDGARDQPATLRRMKLLLAEINRKDLSTTDAALVSKMRAILRCPIGRLETVKFSTPVEELAADEGERHEAHVVEAEILETPIPGGHVDYPTTIDNDERNMRAKVYLKNYYEYILKDLQATNNKCGMLYQAALASPFQLKRVVATLGTRDSGVRLLPRVGEGLYDFGRPLSQEESLICAYAPDAMPAWETDAPAGAIINVEMSKTNPSNVIAASNAPFILVTQKLSEYLQLKVFFAHRLRPVADAPNVEYILNTGVAGCGKTHAIVESLGERTIPIATSRAATDEINERIKRNGVITNQAKTVASTIINGARLQFPNADTLVIDEAVMMHPGEIVYIAGALGIKKVIGYGDPKQLNFISRVDGFKLPVEPDSAACLAFAWSHGGHANASWRSGMDVCVGFRDYCGDDYISVAKARHIRTVEPIVEINGLNDVPSLAKSDKPEDYLYVTYTVKERDEMIAAGYAMKGSAKAKRGFVCTIGQSQGSDVKHVRFVRLARVIDTMLLNNAAQVYVGLTRHKESFTYYRLRGATDDGMKKRVEKILSIVDVVSEHDKMMPNSRGGKKRTNKTKTAAFMIWATVASWFGTGSRWVETRTDVKVQEPRQTLNVSFATTQLHDAAGYLQTFYDDMLPGNSVHYNDYANTRVNYSDINVTVAGQLRFKIGASTGDIIKPRKAYEPLVRTSAAPLRDKSLKRTLFALNKRNLAVNPLSGGVDLSRRKAKFIDRFFTTYWGKDYDEKLRWCQENPIMLDQQLVEEWWNAQSSDVRRTLESRGFDVTVHDLKVQDFEVILKQLPKPADDTGYQAKDPQPQTVMFNSKEVNAVYGPVFREVYDRFVRFCKPNVIVNKGKSFDTLKAAFAQVQTNRPLRFIENDFSEYDKTQDATVYALEMEVFVMLGLPRDLAAKWYAAHIVTSNYCRDVLLTLFVAYQRKSGDVTTSLGNTFTNMMAISIGYEFLEHHEFLLAIFLGDDSLIIVDDSVPMNAGDVGPEIITVLFGFACKVMTFPVGYFCGFYVGKVGEKIEIVSDILRRVDKIGRRDFAKEEDIHAAWVSLGDACRGIDDRNCVEMMAAGMKMRYPKCHAGYALNAAAALVTVVKSYKMFRQLYSNEITESYY